MCGASSWLDEQAIDVEAVHSMAPDANILFVGAKYCLDTGLFAAEQNVIDNGLANVVTNSWADTGGDLFDDAATRTAYDDLFMLADSTGITIQFSTGDDGDNFTVIGLSSANYPSESPYVTARRRDVAPDRQERSADRPARLGDGAFVRVHRERRGRASRCTAST